VNVGVWQNIGDPFMLSGIRQGTSPNERVGRKIKVIGILFRIAFEGAAPGPWTFDLVRDKQCNGVTATTAQVYTDPNFYGTLPNPFEETRFQFLKRAENLNPAQMNFNAGTSVCGISYQKKVQMVVEYAANSGAVSDLSSDNLMLYACTANPTGVITPVGKGFIRVLYTDA